MIRITVNDVNEYNLLISFRYSDNPMCHNCKHIHRPGIHCRYQDVAKKMTCECMKNHQTHNVECFIRKAVDGEEPVQVGHGKATNSHQDRYDAKRGRKIAIGRAIQEAIPRSDIEMRKFVWDEIDKQLKVPGLREELEARREREYGDDQS